MQKLRAGRPGGEVFEGGERRGEGQAEPGHAEKSLRKVGGLETCGEPQTHLEACMKKSVAGATVHEGRRPDFAADGPAASPATGSPDFQDCWHGLEQVEALLTTIFFMTFDSQDTQRRQS